MGQFIYVSAMMKSGSSLMWLVLDAIRSSDSRPHPETIKDVPLRGNPRMAFLPPSMDLLKYFPTGGVLKHHAPVDADFLQRSGCKYVAMLRHPADHLAGFACHMRSSKPRDSFKQEPQPNFAGSVIPLDTFDGSPDQAIGTLIECGYLLCTLNWMADWSDHFRQARPVQGRLLRYEDIVGDFELVAADMCRFIRGTEPDADLMDYLVHVFEHEAASGERKGPSEKYPNGWTGHVGTWANYFSPANIKAYNDLIDRSLQVSDLGSRLAPIYPELHLRGVSV
ncbi:MAG: sulfotransferase domain-containing protein [Bradyrhizobium sp.]|nr:sulfotransferase domain-containing protein [Bradyrhizobium sp.]